MAAIMQRYNPSKRLFDQLQIRSENEYGIIYSPIEVNGHVLRARVDRVFRIFMIQVGERTEFYEDAALRHAYHFPFLDEETVSIAAVSRKNAFFMDAPTELESEDFISKVENLFQKQILTNNICK